MPEGQQSAGNMAAQMGISLAGQLIGAGIQAIPNFFQRKYEQKMYARQKDDAISFWNMQNQYNSPVMQMQRLKEAGLNPNLVYGNGATATGGEIRPPKMDVSNSAQNMVEHTRGIGNSISSSLFDMYNLRLIQAQTNKTNEEALTQGSNRVLNEKIAVLRELEAESQRMTNEVQKRTISTKIAQIRQDLVTSALNARNIAQNTSTSNALMQNYQANTMKTIQDNVRAAALNNITIKQGLQNIEESKSRISLNQSQIGLNKSNIDLNKAHQSNMLIDTMSKKFELWMNKHNMSNKSTGTSRFIDAFYNWFTNEQPKTEQDWYNFVPELDSMLGIKSSYPNLRPFKHPNSH